MCHWNEMYFEIYLSDQTNTQTVISLKGRAKTSVETTLDRYNVK